MTAENYGKAGLLKRAGRKLEKKIGWLPVSKLVESLPEHFYQ